MLKFYDLNVHAYPETEVSAEEMLSIAKRYGYASIALTNHDESIHKEMTSESIFTGVEIRAHSVAELKRKIRIHWGKVTVLAVHGGDDVVNRAALEDPRVDILVHPYGEAGEGELNHISVRYAAENGIALDFNINALIQSRRGTRARILMKMRELVKLVRKYKAPRILTSNAHSIYDLRAPREMIALASLFGMEREEATRALSEFPQAIVEKRWKKEREVEVL
jgi:ribonuclease P/MRP protein subunit RPP1